MKCLSEIVSHFGIPLKIVSDNGRQFMKNRNVSKTSTRCVNEVVDNWMTLIKEYHSGLYLGSKVVIPAEIRVLSPHAMHLRPNNSEEELHLNLDLVKDK